MGHTFYPGQRNNTSHMGPMSHLGQTGYGSLAGHAGHAGHRGGKADHIRPLGHAGELGKCKPPTISPTSYSFQSSQSH